MSLKGKTIGLAVTGSFCTFDKIKQTVQTLIQEEAELYPIFSSHVQTTRSRFGSTDEYIRTISGLAGREPILTIEDAEPIGPVREIPLPSWQTASRIPPYSWLPKPICVMKSLW